MQSDLFEIPINPSALHSPQRIAFLERHRFSVRLDHALVGVIVLIMFYVLIFSYGVEKGKRFAWKEIYAERIKREQIVGELRKKLMKKVFPAPPVQRIASTTPAKNSVIPGVKIAPKSDKKAASDKASSTKAQAADSSNGKKYPEGKYTIQILTYKKQSEAKRAIEDLVKKGIRGFVIPSGVNLAVCVNGFENHSKAKKALGELKSKGVIPADAYVRLIPGPSPSIQ